jgi:endogenous inhibitor of DNA gyrase (YacG/DUF329 family)
MAYEDVNCPYCGKPQDIDHDDGYGYEEGVTHQQQCVECDKTFTYTTSISFYYEAEKADCLNDGEHNWEPTHTIPKFFTKMRCTMCDDERTPTEEEKIKYEIPLTYDH